MARRQKVDYELIVIKWTDAVRINGKAYKARIARQVGISVRTVERALKWGIERGLVEEEVFGPRPFKPKYVPPPQELVVAWT